MFQTYHLWYKLYKHGPENFRVSFDLVTKKSKIKKKKATKNKDQNCAKLKYKYILYLYYKNNKSSSLDILSFLF